MVLRSRPLSPHLQVYKLPVAAVLSIMHRASGLFLYVGVTLLSWFFVLSHYAMGCVASLLESAAVSFCIKALSFLCCVAFSYHYFNGVRHLLWDCGVGLSRGSVMVSGAFVVFLTVAFTAALSFFVWL
ncbi:MAG: succinate dehydrogenase, cytochrome b556 subunit [Anaplasma sp.]